MLSRLEAERREATGRVLDGQEAERLRIAQELHDQIGQELTAVLLALARVERRVPDELRQSLLEVQDAVRGSLEDLRRIAVELRPEALDDLGLESALAVLCERFAERSGLEVTPADRCRPAHPHARGRARRVSRRAGGVDECRPPFRRGDRQAGARAPRDMLTLTVTDTGRGLPTGHQPGTGIRGMSERAALIGATLRSRTPAPEAVFGCGSR